MATAESPYDSDVLAFCRSLPKVELHAHLNGCVRPETIKRLITERGTALTPEQVDALNSTDQRTLADCFKLFDVIHHLTTTHNTITEITREVLHDFEDDGVVYLELRTTPKARPEHGMSKRSYVEAVLLGMREHAARQQPTSSSAASTSGQDPPAAAAAAMMVKLLLSIDRRQGREEALDTVLLAAAFPGDVVGIDLSGNPYVGEWDAWQEALLRARSLGLKVTLHGAEIYAPQETSAMIEFRPDRFGHMCRLNEELEARLMASKVPVELCLTSNLKTLTVPTYADHHFSQFHKAGCPVVLCTDDSGIFGTTLSQEYAVAARAFGLSRDELKRLAACAVDFIFATGEEREQVRAAVEQRMSHIA